MRIAEEDSSSNVSSPNEDDKVNDKKVKYLKRSSH